MLARPLSLLLAGCTVLFVLAPPAAAQDPNIDTVKGPYPGETTTLMVSPRSLTEDISARAVGVRSPDGTRWALTLIGVTATDSIRLTLGGKPLPIKDISRPGENEIGPTRLYLSAETFLTIADRNGVTLHVGNVKTGFPKEMREEMQTIFQRVT